MKKNLIKNALLFLITIILNYTYYHDYVKANKPLWIFLCSIALSLSFLSNIVYEVIKRKKRK